MIILCQERLEEIATSIEDKAFFKRLFAIRHHITRSTFNPQSPLHHGMRCDRFK